MSDDQVLFSTMGVFTLSCLANQKEAPRAKVMAEAFMTIYRTHGGRGFFGRDDCWTYEDSDRGRRSRDRVKGFFKQFNKAHADAVALVRAVVTVYAPPLN